MLAKCGAVIFSTSAPCSAKVRAQVGPASTRVRSRTLMPDRGLSPSGKGSGGLSPILVISNSGREATAAACGCRAHLSMERTMPPAPLAAIIASSSSKASHLDTAFRTASLSSSPTPSTDSAALRWLGKLQCR